MVYTAPFPWFGGKARVASNVWTRFGDVSHYIEPFFGSGAVLLGRPGVDIVNPPLETINDKDGFVANFWRAVAANPGGIAKYADWPVNETDLHARHVWLIEQREDLTARLMGDPDYYDPQIAGWWVWGISAWIGSGWCSGVGPWQSVEGEDGVRRFVRVGDAGQGVSRQRVHVVDHGMGVSRRRVHVGAGGGHPGDGSHGLDAWMSALSARLRRVRVCCGDWLRCCDSSSTMHPTRGGVTGVLLDPPYSRAERDDRLYAVDADIAQEVYDWCIRWGDRDDVRIALCGYEGEIHDALAADHGWAVEEWTAIGGYGYTGHGAGRENKHRERIWYSPACISARQGRLF